MTITDDKGTETPQAIERAGHKGWERVLLGEDSITGTFKLVVYILLFAVVFGSLFYFAG